jgi:hypothetical protein
MLLLLLAYHGFVIPFLCVASHATSTLQSSCDLFCCELPNINYALIKLPLIIVIFLGQDNILMAILPLYISS